MRLLFCWSKLLAALTWSGKLAAPKNLGDQGVRVERYWAQPVLAVRPQTAAHLARNIPFAEPNFKRRSSNDQ